MGEDFAATNVNRSYTLGRDEHRDLHIRTGMYCWRSCRPRNEQRISFEKRSTIHTVTSRTSFGLKRPTRGK